MSMERTKQTNEFIHSLKELEINLKNTNIRAILEKKEFNVITLLHAIKLLSANVDLISDDLLLKLHQKTKELIQHTNYADFTPHYNVFLNPANYLIEYAEEIQNNHNTINEESNTNLSKNDLTILNSEYNFSKNYDKLIEALNYDYQESNLVLETPTEKKPFHIFKAKSSNALVIQSGQNKTPMSISKERLQDVAFNRKEPTYSSYEPVIISKIMDNSIFDYIITSKKNSDFTDALKNQINKQENELIVLRDKLETLVSESEQFSATKEQILELKSNAQNAQKEYEAAKEAAINDTKLKESIKYWEIKQIRHFRQFKVYGSIAVGLILYLIFSLYFILTNHTISTDKSDTNSIVQIQHSEINNTLKDKNKTSITTFKTNNQDTNQSKDKLSLENPIDYLHYFGWYALLIFASSSALWIIRITVKIALSNLHLSEDAHERVVMIQTYLAFINEGHGLDEKDKQLIMTSLFRPSNIGIIQDESSITVADIVSSLKK